VEFFGLLFASENCGVCHHEVILSPRKKYINNFEVKSK
jgi:hypothetical protein